MMLRNFYKIRKKIANKRRFISRPDAEDLEGLGPLQHLPGTWKSEGKGWNMIALPFEGGQPNYRVLMNQYDEFLRFKFVDKGVPNRGVSDQFSTPVGDGDATKEDEDQFIVAIDYEQTINQIAQQDAFVRDGEIGHNGPELIGDDGAAIHHEPGMWLHMLDDRMNQNDVARLANIPHGNALLGIGRSSTAEHEPGDEIVADLNGLPIGFDNINSPYLPPYKFFEDNKFFGVVPSDTNIGGDQFPGFFPTNMAAILQFDNRNTRILKTTKLDVDTDVQDGGILNIPFIERQADAAHMRSTFWIQELEDGKLRLQYIQNVRLDFFPNRGDLGLIKWPHISINTLEKVSDDPDFEREKRFERPKGHGRKYY